MSCTVVGWLSILDQSAFEAYRDAVPDTLTHYQGELLGRGVHADTLANEHELPAIHGIALLKFPSAEQAKAWAEGPEYQAILPVRNQGIRLSLNAFTI